MNDRFRTTLASVALVASLSVAGVASANGGGDHKPGKDHGKPKACKQKHGKGYEVQGLYVAGDLTQVAGADTARWGDDRWSGTVEVEVLKGNRRGRRDIGLSSYAVKNVRVVGAKDGVIPDEGTRLQLVGKQNAGCVPAPTTPTTPTTPEPTTPEPTTPEPTATLAEYGPEEPAEETSEDTPEVSEDSRHDKGGHDDQPGKGKPAPEAPYPSDHGDHGDDYDDYDEEEDASDDEIDVATPVTDVTIRVVHFKVRPAAARR